MKPCILSLGWVLSTAALGGADFVGTDLLAGTFAEELRKVVPACTVDFAGTLPGKRALVAGQAAAAVMCLRPGEAIPVLTGPRPAVEIRFAAAAVLVAVHGSNRVEALTLEQLANAFAKEARSSARNWNDIFPAARSELITPAICSPEGTLVLEIFQGIALEGLAYRADIRQRIPLALADDLVTARAGALILTPQRPPPPARVLALADGRLGRSTTAYSPEAANLYNGDYPLQVPLIIYVRPEKLAELRPALRWMLSDAAAKLLQAQGLHPAPSAIRVRLAQRLDTP